MGAGAGGALRVELHFLAGASLVEAGEQLRLVRPGPLRQGDQRGARLGELGPVVLLLIERVMRRPKPPLPPGAHGDLRRGRRIGVDAREGKVDEDPAHLSSLDVFPFQGGQHRHREQAASGTLKVRHLVDCDRGIGTPLGALREGVIRLRCRQDHDTPSQPERERESHGSNIRKTRGMGGGSGTRSGPDHYGAAGVGAANEFDGGFGDRPIDLNADNADRG